MADGPDADGEVRDAMRAQVLDRLSEGVFGLDADWTFTYLNEAAREVIPDLVETRFEQRYREALRTQDPVSFDA